MSDDLTHDKVGLVVSSPYFMMGNVKPIASSVQLSIQGNHGCDSIMVSLEDHGRSVGECRTRNRQIRVRILPLLVLANVCVSSLSP